MSSLYYIFYVWPNWDTGKIKASDKIMFEYQKKRKYENKRYFT